MPIRIKHVSIILHPVFLCIFLAAFWYDVNTVPLVVSHIPFALASLDALIFKQWSTSAILALDTGVSIWYHVGEYELYLMRHPSRRLFGPWPFKKMSAKDGDYAVSSCYNTTYGPLNTHYSCQKHWSYWVNETTLPTRPHQKVETMPPKDLVATVKMSTHLDSVLSLISLHYMAWQMTLPRDLAFALALVGLACHKISNDNTFTAVTMTTAAAFAIGRKRSVHTVAGAIIVGVALHFYSVGLTYKEDEHAARWGHNLWHICAGWSASHAIRARMGQWQLPMRKSPNALITPNGIAVGFIQPESLM